MNIDFQAELSIRLDWSDMDLLGHINNVEYFKYTQASRINFLESLGVEKLQPGITIGPILAKTECDFKKTLHFPDTITIKVRCIHVGKSSIQLNHHIFNSKGELVAEATDVLVLFNFKTNKKVVVSGELREKLSGYSE